MAERRWTDEQREAALLALHDGASLGEVHADTGIPKGTLASWKRRQTEDQRAAMLAELDTPAERAEAAAARRARTQTAREQLAEVTARDRLQMAARLRDEVHGLLDRINSPTEYVHVKVISDGADAGQSVVQEVVQLNLPTAADTKALVTAAALLVDKLQLLTGEATERHEHTGGPLDLDAEYVRLLEAHQAGDLTQADGS